MPRLAATLASILLIASSIGVNIVRYPQVGRSIEPSTAGAAETAISQSSSSAQSIEKIAAEKSPNKPVAAAPAAREADWCRRQRAARRWQCIGGVTARSTTRQRRHCDCRRAANGIGTRDSIG